MIYALFSIKNEHYQPEFNLVAFWYHKPTVEELLPIIDVVESESEKVQAMINGIPYDMGYAEYRIEQVEPNQRIK